MKQCPKCYRTYYLDETNYCINCNSRLTEFFKCECGNIPKYLSNKFQCTCGKIYDNSKKLIFTPSKYNQCKYKLRTILYPIVISLFGFAIICIFLFLFNSGSSSSSESYEDITKRGVEKYYTGAPMTKAEEKHADDYFKWEKEQDAKNYNKKYYGK